MLVFVYGTLKAGGRLHGHMAGSRFVGEAATQPVYRLYRIGWFPGLVDHSDGLAIRGEVWDVSPETLRILDEVEEVDVGLFQRRAIQLAAPFNGSAVESYFYLGSVSEADDSGDCW
jgi:gamma-glutamylaminecyclotransferase